MTWRSEILALADKIDNATSVEVVTFQPLQNENTRRYLDAEETNKIVKGLIALAAMDSSPGAGMDP